MGSFANTLVQLQQMQTISARLRRKLLGDARSELANAITDHLLVFGDSIYHLESGTSQPVSEESEAALASSARQLLKDNGSGDRFIKLFLPPSEFVATSSHMPGISAENLESALNLQRDTLLPAFETDLALAVPSVTIDDQDVVALWMPRTRLTELFEAFAEHDLLLAIVQPRNLCMASEDRNLHVLDQDESDLTLISWNNSSLSSWLSIKKADLEEKAFSKQWHENLEPLSNVIEASNEKLQSYLEHKPSQFPGYGFYPDGAISARKKVEKSRQLMLAASVFAGLLLIAALPFLLQGFELQMAEARLSAAREMSTDARADQRIVVDFENEWGTINDFPDQQVGQAMFRLQEVLGTERLTSLELNEGLIRIQGTSSDPQAILQRLEQDPMFTEVVFSRATNNTRYYIDLRLATVNFEAYLLRYFPEQS